MAKLELMNYKEDTVNIENVDLDKLDDIFMIVIRIVSGDEIAEVIYKGGDIEVYDPFAYSRLTDFYDGEVVLYSPKYNRIDRFKNRTSTYDWPD